MVCLTLFLFACLKTANGNVEAKVVCLFRRRDISTNLNTLADSNASEYLTVSVSSNSRLFITFKIKTRCHYVDVLFAVGVGDMPKSYITIWQLLYHDNNIYHDIVFFSFNKVFIILKSLIPYNFHNPCHQCQYQTNTSLKTERKNNSTSLKINKQSVMK